MATAMLDKRPVQMNVRMDRQLKEAGDAVLQRIGMTPSQAVRELWSYLVERGRMPVTEGHAEAQVARGKMKGDLPEYSEGAALLSNFYERYSISRTHPDDLPGYDDLYAQMMDERYSDWIER